MFYLGDVATVCGDDRRHRPRRLQECCELRIKNKVLSIGRNVMRAWGSALSRVGVMVSVFAFLFSTSVGAADALAPDLQKVRQALDKYQDPIAAVHDGYFSTLGCV